MQTIFNIYKPVGPTSFDMVYKIRKITGVKKVGHAGTLDPLAEGVLVMGVTREGTKQMADLVKEGKEYIAKIKFGENSTTDDAEGAKTPVGPVPGPVLLTDIQEALKQFIGKIQQTPPQFSAIKIKGKSAYKMARKGEKVEIKSREVEIKDIEILDYSWPYLDLRIETGSGVYIRAIARDLGAILKTGGYLAALKRTRVGQFKVKDALNLDEFEVVWDQQNE